MNNSRHVVSLTLLSISCLMFACSGGIGDGYFVVMRELPDPLGQTSIEIYVYPIDDVGIGEQGISMIFDKYDDRSKDVDDFDELSSLYQDRQAEITEHVISSVSALLLLDLGSPTHVVRLPMSGLDQQLFRDESRFLGINSITPEAIRNAKKRPIDASDWE